MTSDSAIGDLLISAIPTNSSDRPLTQHPLSSSETGASNGCTFDPHCPECVRELWGPLLSPFAYLIKQNAQYFNEAFGKIGDYKVQSPMKSLPGAFGQSIDLQNDDHRFLTPMGSCAFSTGKMTWLAVWTLGFFLFIMAITLLVLRNQSLPPLIVLLRLREASEWGMMFTLTLILIVISFVGTGKMFASVFGIFGMTYRTESVMLGTLVLISVLILFEIGATIYLIVVWSDWVTSVEKALETSFQDAYGGPKEEVVTVTWDRIFQNYQCCGWTDADFSKTKWTPPGGEDIPYSCCRPGASYTSCTASGAPATETYTDQDCRTAVRGQLQSMANISITLVLVILFIIIEIAGACLTYGYTSALKQAGLRRRRHNARLMDQYQQSSSDQTKDKSNVNGSSMFSSDPTTQVDDLRQLYNHYGAFHQNPPDMDPSLMSITPTVVQVKRPEVYSYFYYE